MKRPSIIIKTNNGNHEMNVDEYTRWLCLVEALEVISESYKNKNEDMDKTSDWIRPIPIQKYINERFYSMRHDFIVEEHIDAFDDVDLLPNISYETETKQFA